MSKPPLTDRHIGTLGCHFVHPLEQAFSRTHLPEAAISSSVSLLNQGNTLALQLLLSSRTAPPTLSKNCYLNTDACRLIGRKINIGFLFTLLHSNFHSQPCPKHPPACCLLRVFNVAVQLKTLQTETETASPPLLEEHTRVREQGALSAK